MDAKELLKKELREALMDPELYKKFKVTRDRPVRTSCRQSSRGIMQQNSDVKRTIKCMGTEVDATKDTDGTNFGMEHEKDSSRATATTVISAINSQIGPLLLNENISNNSKILKPKPTAPLTRKIQIVSNESIHKSCKNPNFVFRPISPAGQQQEAQRASPKSPKGGLLTFKDLMDRNEHKAYEGEENRVTAGNCNIYKQILAAAKENRKSSLKMPTRSDVEYPCSLDTNLTYNVHQSLQNSIPQYTEGKLRKILMHIANSDETSLDTQMQDLEHQSKSIEILPSLSAEGKFDADHQGCVSKEAVACDLGQPSAVFSKQNYPASDAIPNNHDEDFKNEKDILPGISDEDKFDADQCASVSKEASAHDLVQPSVVVSDSGNTVSDAIPNNHDEDFKEDKDILPGISTEDKVDADLFASVSKEASAHDLVQPSVVVSDPGNTVPDAIPNNHGEDFKEDRDVLPGISAEDKFNADQCASVSKEAPAHDLVQPSVVVSDSGNTVSDAIPNNHDEDFKEDKDVLPGISAEDKFDADQCAIVSKDPSAHDLVQPSAVVCDPGNTVPDAIPNNHGDDVTEDKEILHGISTEDKFDADQCASVSKKASAHDLVQPSVVVNGPINITGGAISVYNLGQLPSVMSKQNISFFEALPNSHGDSSTQEQEPCGLHTTVTSNGESCEIASKEESAHTMDQPSTDLSESNKTIFDDIYSKHSDKTTPEEDIPCDLSHPTATTYNTERCLGVTMDEASHKLYLSSTVLNEAIPNNHGDSTKQDQEIPSDHSTVAKYSAVCEDFATGAHTHDLGHPSAVVGDTSIIFDDTPNSYSNISPNNEAMQSDQARAAQYESNAYVKGSSICNKSSGLINNPYRNEDGDEKVSSNISEDSSIGEDDMLNEVYQSCLAKEMRPKYISKNYLKNLANARKTAEEIKARKPEPRVKLDKPCRLDTNLTYAVRQSLKRSLPLIAGKNKLSALMVMADGMFDEMSLDRDLDDLAWPYDPLAELRKSGLAMVDYMDPHPAGGVINNKSLMKNQSAAMRSQSNKTIFDESQTNLDDDTSKEAEVLSNDSQETFTNHDSGRCVDVSSESSAHKLDQCKGMLSESNKIDDIKKNYCDVTYEEQEMPSDNSQGTVTNNDSERCVDVSSESSAHKLDQCKGMLSESNKTDDIKNNHCGATYEEQEMPSDNSQGTVTGNDSERCVDVSSESSAHKLDQCKGMLSESNKTDDIKNNHCGATYEEQEMPSDNSQGTVTGNDSERCVDVSSELSAHKLDQCKGMLSESNKTDDIKNNHCGATYEEQEMPSDNSQGTVTGNDSEKCVDVSSELSAHKLDQCKGMLSESNKTVADYIKNNHCDATYGEQEMPSDNSLGPVTNNDPGRCVDVPMEASAYKLDLCPAMLSESNGTIFDDFQNNCGGKISSEQEIPFDNSQGIPTDCGSEKCVDVSTESSAHNLNHFEGMLSESNKTIIEDIQKNQNDSRSDVQELLSDNFQGSGVVNERDITIFNAVRDIRKDQEILSSLGTTLEVSEEGCAGVSKEVPIHKQYHVPADLGEKGTSASNYIDVKPESQEIPSDQPVVTDHDEENSAYVKEDTSGYEMNQSLDSANNPVMERSKNNGGINLSISDNSTDDDDKDMLNEVYQSCLAKEMRPKYISKNYLKNLANARKTAEEIKARKPEPRVKLDKPCRLDTNLTYAVRQSLKRSLPLIAGKNKLSALMVMADGMFDEMSLDRDLDDLAWPYDPLAELRKSGLAMVDYMDPHPASTPTMNTSDMKDQSSQSDSVVPFASSQDENDHNSSGTVVKIPGSVATIKSPLPANEQKSIGDKDISSTDFNTEVSRLTCQPIATSATEDLPSPQHNITETSLGTTVLREDLPDSSIENDSEIGSSVEIQESSQFDNLIDNHNILMQTVKCDPVDLEQISSIDLIPPSSHSSDIVQTMSIDSDLQSEDSALGQDNSSTSFDDTYSTSDFSSDIEEVDPSSQNLKQKIQFFSNATWTSFSKPSSVSHVSFKVSVPSKVHHFEKLAQQERSSGPQSSLAKDHRLAAHNRLSSAGDAKIKIEQFERKRVPTVPIVNTKHDTTDSMIKEDNSASKVNVMNRVKMFELSEDLAAFNKPSTSAAKPKISGRLNKSKIAFFEHLANSNI